MQSTTNQDSIEVPTRRDRWRPKLTDVILLLVLALAAYLRFTGLNWDDHTHPHPDERFLTMVEGSLRLPESLGEYFDTENSGMNPHNVGFGFFVYGTFPIFIVRYLAEWFNKLGYDQVHLLGRAAAASFDLISLILLYLIGSKLYRRRVGLLAAAFGAVSVLLIQHAHYFVVDPFANTFILLGFYFAVEVIEQGRMRDYALFGLALGMATASKVSAAPLAGVVLLAGIVRFSRRNAADPRAELLTVLKGLVLAAAVSLLTFRILQPYAFVGTSFFDVRLNPKWLSNLNELRVMSSGKADIPPAWQWADRPPVLFSLWNLVVWGLGLPLGLAAVAGWCWAVVRMWRKDWHSHLLPVVWSGAYFLYQSVGFTTAMRYQLPIYPTMALLAAWGLWEAWDLAGTLQGSRRKWVRASVSVLGAAVLLLTTGWALAFLSIYTRNESRVQASRWIYTHVPGVVNLVVDTGDEQLLEPIPMSPTTILAPGSSFETRFHSNLEGTVSTILLPHVRDLQPEAGAKSLVVILESDSPEGSVLATASYQGMLSSDESMPLTLALDHPVEVQSDQSLLLRLELFGAGALELQGSVIISETSWDLGMPSRVDGKDGFGGYYTGVNQELYWPDNNDDDENGVSDKLERLVDSLSSGDYLAISSNRQYGSVARIIVRYPLTAAYYRALFGCPETRSIANCAARAQPGEIQGELGYELVAVFESNPRLGPWEISDQLAEEAFTVYDHSKVLIFAKSDDFNEAAVRSRLAQVDLSQVQNILPMDARSAARQAEALVEPSLLLPQDRLQEQRQGGTWSDLYDRLSPVNRSQLMAIVVWWLVISLIGWGAFPWVRRAFGGLALGGYALSRLVGLLLVAWGSWMLASFRIPFTSRLIWLVMIALGLASAGLAWADRVALRDLLRRKWREIVWIEVIGLGFFLLMLAIRIGNPDLWHPAKGGEKPMDFAYLNAVLKSTSFPPFDPWFAGGYINYYYFGFVLVAIPVKLIGLVPSQAYNLILPMLYALLALAAYCVGYNLTVRNAGGQEGEGAGLARLSGVAAAVGLVLLGNLGTARMIYDGLKQLGASGLEPSKFLIGMWEALLGAGRLLFTGESLPYGLGSWYWDPSRVIPAAPGEPGPITEFPFFTFLYADLHAHMISLPLTVAGLAWALSWLLSSGRGVRRTKLDLILGLLTGGLILGALRPTNTWDLPVYLALGVGAVVVGAFLVKQRKRSTAVLEAVVLAGLLVGLALILYRPFTQWYGQAYTRVDLWEGSRTPLSAYFTVHGLFLFVLLTWMSWESRQWMASTPLSALNRLRPRIGLSLLIAFSFAIGIIILLVVGYDVSLLVIPVLVWAGLLLLRKGLPLEKRVVLVLFAGALALTTVVEAVVLRGDIGRMNTVFKFYLQVWTLLSLSSGAALGWLFADLSLWKRGYRRAFLVLLVAGVLGAALYPITATPAKVKDRMASDAPHSLDGMAYMPYAFYHDVGQAIPLAEDYRAIQWMQDNVEGSPVIVESSVPEYRWGSRFSIYTGLPGVLGWNWHQRQQRAAAGDASVWQRNTEISTFYLTSSLEEAQAFLETYDVRYVIVGAYERAYFERIEPCRPKDASGSSVTCDLSGRPIGSFTPEVSVAECVSLDPQEGNVRLSCPTHGLEKFPAMVAQGLLREAYRENSTVIYAVLP